jgi:preprotein translocase subunit YajC
MPRPAAAEPPFFMLEGPMTASTLVAQTGGSQFPFFISLALMVAIFYFLLIRPQQRRARQQRDLVGSLDVGDEVVTIGGIHGVIAEVDDETVTLDVGGGTRIRFIKQAVARKRVIEEEEPEEEEEEADEET